MHNIIKKKKKWTIMFDCSDACNWSSEFPIFSKLCLSLNKKNAYETTESSFLVFLKSKEGKQLRKT